MSAYAWGDDCVSLQLTSWELLVDERWAPIEVPHNAMRDVEDVRAGGTARYRLDLDVSSLKGDETLAFDGLAVDPRVYVNGVLVGQQLGNWTPLSVPVGGALTEGRNTVEVLVDLPDYGTDSPAHFRNLLQGFVPDVVGPFAGIWQGARLERRSGARFDYAVEQAERAISVTWEGGPSGELVRATVVGDGRSWTASAEASAGRMRLACPGATPWTPEDPKLARLTIAAGEVTVVDEAVGFRELRVDGQQITISSRPVFVRGVLHWGFYPESGLPALPAADARAELELIQQMGFTCVKFCLFVPPQHVLDLCDELGLIVWQELPLWLPRDIKQTEARMAEEYPRILAGLRRHPSVVIVSLGCELDATVPTELLDRHYAATRAALPDAVICANSGSGEAFGGGIAAESDLYDYHFYGDLTHLRDLFARFTQAPREPKPWIFGEYNDFDTWRVAERAESADQPWWLSQSMAINPLRSVHAGFASDQPIYRQGEIIAEQGYAAELEGLEELSLKQGSAARKLVLEHSRTYPSIGGYVLTVLRDTPITTAGFLDVAGRPKWAPAEVAQLNAPVLLSVASPPSRRWHRGGDRLVLADPYNLRAGAATRLSVIASNTTAVSGRGHVEISLSVGSQRHVLSRADVAVAAFGTSELIELEFQVPTAAAVTLPGRLVASLHVEGEQIAINEWDVNVHPDLPGAAGTVILDPAGGLDHLATRWGITPTRTWEEARVGLSGGGRLVTTIYRQQMLADLERVDVFSTTPGDVFDATRVPFWRENVTRVHDEPWLRSAYPTEHLSTPAMGVATDRMVTRAELDRVAGEFVPLITRYDARTYVAGQYLFEWRPGGAGHTICTLSLAGGTGIQPQFAAENVLGARLLEAWMTR